MIPKCSRLGNMLVVKCIDILTFLNVQKVAPPPATVLCVATMVVLLLLEYFSKLFMEREEGREVGAGAGFLGLASVDPCWSCVGMARGWTKTPMEGRKM